MTMVYLGMALGILHVFYYDTSCPFDVVPVDYTVNALIAVTYDVVQQWKLTKKPIVYNYGSRTTNPVRYHQQYKWLMAEASKIGSTRAIWYPFVVQTHNYALFWILHVLFHFVPGTVIFRKNKRFFLFCSHRAVKFFFFVTRKISMIDYFGNGDWRINSDKTLGLYERMNQADQTIFNFDVRKLDWEYMTMLYIRGGRLHILKESFDNLKLAKRRFVRMKILHYVVTSFVLLVAAYFTMKMVVYACEWYGL
uniref:FAR11 n=1 Tax=Tetrastichus brontispae TaxID=2033808 RepID=A0A650FKT8_9HYME|nr:FAR11 [Tetrastichus brontispae]